MNGIIAWYVRNQVAANLLMVFITFGGLLSYFTIVQEVFPDMQLGGIEISVDYPGASPEEVEEAIIQRIEDQVEGIEGVKQILGTAAEGLGTVQMEFERGQDMGLRLDEVKAEIDRITSFPEDAEEAEVSLLTSTNKEIQVAIYGDASEGTLKELANRVKEELALKSTISLVQVSGVRDYEIYINVSNDTLRSYGLSLRDVSAAIRQSSLDMPGGDIETSTEQLLLRTKGQNYNRQDFEDIVVLTTEDGAQIRLRDIATVDDGFKDSKLSSTMNGKPAAFVDIFRIGSERLPDISATVEQYLAEELPPTLPAGVQATIWKNFGDDYSERMGLLLKNGGLGLILVIIALTLFLDIRLAFWTSLGIFIAFIGAFVVMGVTGPSLNMMTMFGFILAIGIIVDDAIVTGENIFRQGELGLPPQEAAIAGAQRVAVPVIFAVSTTIATFVPLLYIPATIGQFLAPTPAIVIIVLFLSLIESLLILPRHLSHLTHGNRSKNWFVNRLEFVQGVIKEQLRSFTEGPLRRALEYVTGAYFTTIVAGIAAFAITIGFVSGGYVKFEFFPVVEATEATASIELPVGSSVNDTRRIASHVQQVGLEIAEEFRQKYEPAKTTILDGIRASIGSNPDAGGPSSVGRQPDQPQLANIVFKLIKPADRSFSTEEFANAWREAVGVIPDARKMKFSTSFISIGSPVQVELTASDTASLMRGMNLVKDELAQIEGVYDIADDLDGGRREIQLSLKPEARTFGLTVESLAQQIRAAFFGDEALRMQRGRDEVRVKVRLPDSERDSLSDLNNYRIRTPAGDFIPLQSVADFEYGSGPATIRRRNGRRVATITAQVDTNFTTGSEATSYLSREVMPRVENAVPGLAYEFGGNTRQQTEALPGLMRNFIMAMFAIYALLAMAFRSYLQPLVVLAAIPFGFIGAIMGHVMLDVTLTMVSIFGIVGLSGVIVNDALVMMDFIKEEHANGKSMRQSIIDGTIGRFRPIMLTSITTFLGMFPLILEPSVQAQFLIPAAISIAFGILFGTIILVLLVPAFAMAQHDFVQLFRRREAVGLSAAE